MSFGLLELWVAEENAAKQELASAVHASDIDAIEVADSMSGSQC